MQLTEKPFIPWLYLVTCLACIFLFFSTASSAMLSTPGPEAASLLALVASPLLLLAACTQGAKRYPRGFLEDIFTQLLWTLGLFFAYVILCSIRSWFSDNCSEHRGISNFLILTLPTLYLNGVIGLWIGRLAGRPKRAVLAGMLFLIGYMICVAYCWWVDPSFRIATHLSVVVTGDLFEGYQWSQNILLYRLATMLFALALSFLGLSRFKGQQRSEFVSQSSIINAWTIASALLFVAGICIHIGTIESIIPSKDEMYARYVLALKKGPIIVHADPLSLSYNDVNNIATEGSFWLSRLEKRLGLQTKKDIHIWLHDNAESQAYYTGALHAHFALPMRREIHISYADIPHPTLGHEIAHILIGEKSTTIFGVPGLLGFLPNIGLTEGLAVALTPELNIRHGLTMEEQTAAMVQLGIVPNIDTVFSPWPWHFWGEESHRAYIFSGALLASLLGKELESTASSKRLLYKLIEDGAIEDAFIRYQDWPNFQKTFLKRLRQLSLPPDALFSAERIYKTPPIFSRTCNHEILEEQRQIKSFVAAGMFKKATNIIKLHPETLTPDFTIALADMASQGNYFVQSLNYLDQVFQYTLSEGEKTILLEQKANILYQQGRVISALEIWKSTNAALLSPFEQRQLAAKIALAMSSTPSAATAIHILLKQQNPNYAMWAKLGYFVKGSSDESAPVAQYILGRYLALNGQFATAIGLLQPLASKQLLESQFLLETNKLLAYSYATTNPGLSETILQLLLASNLRVAERLIIQDIIERIAYPKKEKSWLAQYRI